MPPLAYWFSGAALAAFIAFAGSIGLLGYSWYRAANRLALALDTFGNDPANAEIRNEGKAADNDVAGRKTAGQYCSHRKIKRRRIGAPARMNLGGVLPVKINPLSPEPLSADSIYLLPVKYGR
jgi:hypothetical protein